MSPARFPPFPRTAAAVGVLLAAAGALAPPATGCSGDGGAVTPPPPSTKAGGTGGNGGSAGGAGGSVAAGTPAAGGPTSRAGAAGEAGAGGVGDFVPVCGDAYCDHEDGEDCDLCAADCGVCSACGNGTCERELGGEESCKSCPEDCGACSTCGDGTCAKTSGETCQTCVEDCGDCATCGNGTCDDEETCSSCKKDCGECKACGDGKCGAGETCGNCPADCDACPKCGDTECNGNETTASCPKDCPAGSREGCLQGDFKPYWGGLHAHTHISDGEGSPSEAFAHAKTQTMDFLWLSDHHGSITPAEYDGCVADANKHNSPTFATGCGYEVGVFVGKPHASPFVGHFNVLFPNKLYDISPNSPGVFEDVAKCEECLGQFNHPPKPHDFDGYAFRPVAKDRVRLMEFNGGPWESKLPHFFKALDNGWTLSPSYNEDNHHKKWGDDRQGTLVWATALTRPALRAGVNARRTAAVGDKSASIKVIADGKCWMGSELKGLGKTTLTVTLKDKKPARGFGVVTLHGKGGKKLAEKSCGDKNPCTVEFSQTLTESGYLVVVARQAGGGWLVSAPTWYDK